MIRTKIVSTLLLLTFIIVTSFSIREEVIQEEDLTIHLRWHQSYDQEDQDKVEKGLKWTLAHLGALLPKKKYV